VHRAKFGLLLTETKVAINFEMFHVPYVVRAGIASLCTVCLVKRFGRGWRHVQWVQ